MVKNEIVLSGARWMAVKWWACNGREDLTARATLSVDSLRAAGFLARIGERTNEARVEFEANNPEWGPGTYTTLLRVEVFCPNEVHQRARHHLRGLWAALESRGMPKDYRAGYSSGVGILLDAAKPKQPKPKQVQAVRQNQLPERCS